MLIFWVDFSRFSQSWLILSIFGLLILKWALRGIARAHWALPLTSMVKQISDFNIGPMERSIYRNKYRSDHRYMVKLCIGYIANRAEYRYIELKKQIWIQIYGKHRSKSLILVLWRGYIAHTDIAIIEMQL